MALEGIRLTDIYGYDNNDYLNYVDNNIETIKRVHQQYGYDTEDDAAAELYLNNLIRKKIGNEGYDSNVRNKHLDVYGKLDFYNSLFDDVKESQRTGDTNLITEEYDSQFDNTPDERDAYTLWFDGDMNPNSKNSPVQQMKMREWFRQKSNSSNRDDEEEVEQNPFGFIKPNKEQDFELQIFDKLYDPNYLLKDKSETSDTEIQLDVYNYSKDIRSKLDNDPEFTYNLFSHFEDIMEKTSPYYRNYHDTNMMEFTPNEMKDILSNYYAIKSLSGDDEAQRYAAATFQNKVASEQGLWNKFSNGWYAGAANLTGSLISAAGIVGNTIPAIIRASSKNDEIDDLSWIKEVFYYAADNPLTRFGNDCIETGSWNKDTQIQRKESGYNPYANVRKYGNETTFMDINTFFDIGPQMMFTVAGMVQGGFANMALKGTVKAATNPIARKLMLNGSTRFYRTIGRGIDDLGDMIVVAGTAALPAASEASMDALQTYDDIMNDGFEGVNDALGAIVREAMENGEFQDFYNSRTSFEMPSKETLGKLSDEELEYLGAKQQQNINDLYNEFVEMKRQQIMNDKEFASVVQNEALRQVAKNMFDETMFISFGDMFFTNVLGGGFKASKKAIGTKLGMYSPYKLTRNAEGALRVKDESFNFWKGAKGVTKGLIEATEEGVEESFQTVSTEARKDVASNYVTQWLLNRHDLTTAEEFYEATSDEWDIIKRSAKENVLSDESRFSFLMGAVSAGFGSPTVANGIRHAATSYTNGQATTFKEVAKDLLRNSWRNPLVEGFREAKVEQAKRKNEIDAVNRWLSDHDEVAKMQDFFSIYSWAKQQEDYAVDDNEKDFRDAKMGQQVATMFMMDRIGGSAKEKSFSKKLKELSQLSENSDAAKSVINQALAIQGIENPTEEQKHEVYLDIVSKAKDMYEMQQDIHEARKWIQGNFGEILDAETIDAWTYETIMHKNLIDRVNEIDQFVKDSYNTSQNVKKNPRAASSMDNFIAKYGSLEHAKEVQKELQKELSDAKSHKLANKQKLGTFGYRSYISGLKEKIDKIKSDIKEFGESGVAEDQVVLAENIAFLDTESRAALLKEENQKNLSDKQKNEIRKFKEVQKVDADLLASIQDAADLLERYNTFSRQFKDIQKDAQSVSLYNNEVHAEVVRRMATKGLKGALEAEDYDTFKKAVDDFRNNPQNQFSVYVMNDVLKDNKFYKDYLKELNDRKDALHTMSLSGTFKSLDDDRKRLLTQAYSQALQDGDTSFGNVLKYVRDEKILSDLNLELGLDTQEFIEDISEILKQIDNHKKNTDKLKDLEKKLSDPGSGKPVANPTTKTSARSLILNNKYYDEHRDNINRIISSIHKYLVGKRRSIKLAVDDFISFMNLFTGELISNNTLVDLKPTDLSLESMVEVLNKLQESIDSYKMSHTPDSYSEEFLNTFRLYNAINNYINKYSASRIRSGINISEADFLRATLANLTPELRAQLGSVKKKDSTNIGVVNVKVKLDKHLTYEAEKEYYKTHDIAENRKQLQKYSTSPIVLIHDSELSNKILNESGLESFDSDNLPLVIAVIVPSGTKNSIVVDGQTVLPFGLIKDSRVNPDKDVTTNLNNLRQLAIDSNTEGIIKNVDGTIYQMKGLTIKTAQNTDSSMSSVRDYLIKKFGGREAAVKAFKEGIVKVKLTKESDDRIGVEYRNPYTNEVITSSYNIPEGSWNERKEHTMLAYVDKDNPLKPVFLKARGINEVSLFEDSDQTIYDILNSGVDIMSNEFAKKDINNIRKAIATLANKLGSKIDSIINYGKAEAAKVSLEITNEISKNHLNFGKLSKDEKPLNRFDIRYDKESNTLSIYLKLYDRDNDTYSDILLAETNQLDKKKLNKEESKIIIKQLAIDAIKNLMFNEDGSPRMNADNTYPLVKLQVKQEDAVDRTSDYARKLLLTNVFYGQTQNLEQEIDDIDVNPTSQRKYSEDRRKATIEKLLPLFSKSRALPSDHIQATTFIKSQDDDESLDRDDLTVAQQTSLSLGTSIDKLIRVYYQTGKTKDGVIKWMKDNNLHYWLGFGSQGNEQFNKVFREIEKISKFFEDRDEVPFTDEAKLWAQLEDEFGRTALVAGIPDIITVDKNGKIHIYDMKSFKYATGSNTAVPGFTNDKFFIKGMKSADYKIDSWQKQLSLYKAMIEQIVGKNSVASIGVIPITLDYKVPGGTIITSNPITALDERGQVFDIRIPIAGSEKSTPLHVDNIFISGDFIQIQPILELSKIGSEKWRSNTGDSSISSIIKSKNEAKEQGHIEDMTVAGMKEVQKVDLDTATDDELDDLLLSLMPDTNTSGLEDRLNNNECSGI